MKKFVLWLVIGLIALAWGINAGRAYAGDGGRVDGSADAHFNGKAPNDAAGFSIAGAGDVNGDGFDDFLVGSPLNDDGPGNDGGAAYLVLGGTNGWSLGKRLGQAPTIQYIGEAAADQAGFSVAGAGDVNGDGFNDLLIGAPFNGSVGAVYLVLGSASPTGGALSTAIKYTGELSGDQAGFSLAGGGDVNGDGFDDFLVGAPFNDDGAGSGTDDGAVYLVLGSAGPTGGSLGAAGISEYTGELGSDNAGQSVALVGDTNRDGLADFLIGAPGNDEAGANSGAAYLIPGSPVPAGTGLGSGVPIVKLRGSGSENAGSSVAGAGDVNSDGFADILIGAPSNDTAAADAGAAYLVLLRPGLPPNSLLVIGIPQTGEAAGDQAGTNVAGAGDTNGDGYADFLIGAPFHSTTDTGAAYLVLGSAGPTSASLSTAVRYTGVLNNDKATAVAAAGDANGDGLADFLIGATDNDIIFSNSGGAYLIFGGPLSSTIAGFRHRQNLNPTGNPLPVSFDQAGVQVDFTAGALIDGDINVTRHTFHPCATDRRLVMPIWTIESSKIDPAGNSTINLRFKYNEAHIEGMIESNLQVWTRPTGHPCADWVAVGSVVDVAHNFITVVGLSSLGQFTIADGAPSPTAVEDLAVAVRPGGTAVLPTLLLVTAGITFWAVRRSSPILPHPDQPNDHIVEEVENLEPPTIPVRRLRLGRITLLFPKE